MVRQKALEESKSELEASKDEYETLKGRVKVVAGELKERRMDCRALQSEVDILKSTNHSLQDSITHLQADGMDMNKSTNETREALNALRGQLMDKETALSKAHEAMAVGSQKGEDQLSAYKKKAQSSLALANARIASAVQAKEEAEMEARAARSTADSAMERGTTAQRNGKEALAEAKAYVAEMEVEFKKYNQVKDALELAKTELTQLQVDAETYQEKNETLTCELQTAKSCLEAEQKSSQDVRDVVGQAESRSNELYEEVERLRKESQRLKDDLQRARTTISEEKNSEEKTESSKTRSSSSSSSMSTSGAEKHNHNAEAEATIAMLQHDLQDANQAIKELKETLVSTLNEQAHADAHPEGQSASSSSNANGNNGDNTGGMPLFYAMEKQAELTQARNELARLANLVGNAESSKQEAMDAMEEMQQLLDESQAKLKRQDQSSARSPEQERVNLEYLKNVMLSYLNAKTMQEKKTLLPVMGTVLCWTPDETRQAMDALEKSSGRVMDTVSSSFLGKLNWS
jgi:chromosome segregation ATPase